MANAQNKCLIHHFGGMLVLKSGLCFFVSASKVSFLALENRYFQLVRTGEANGIPKTDPEFTPNNLAKECPSSGCTCPGDCVAPSTS